MLIGWQDYWTFITPSNFYGIFPEAKYTEGVRVPLPDAIRNVNYFDVLTVSDGAQKGVADAVVQAAGKVSITASQEINNSVVREGLPVSSELGIALNTQVSANTSSTIVNLNSQLPPDLARQQITPLTLPGFSLPQGQNGLFRLASQGAQVNQASGALKSASDLTQSGHGVSVSAQAGSDASGWSTQARRVGDDRVTSLAGSAYQGRVAEAIDALRASAPISGDGETLAVSRPVSTRRPRDWVDSSRAMHRVTAAMASSSPICAVVYPRSQAFPRLIVFKAQRPVTMGMELFSPIGRVRRRRSRPRLRQCV